MKRLVPILAVLLVLVAFPAVSYIYLQRGMNFRISALDLLKISDEESQLTQYLNLSDQLEKGRINVVFNMNNVVLDQVNFFCSEFADPYRTTLHLSNSNVDDGVKASFSDCRTKTLMHSEFRDALRVYDILLIDTMLQLRHGFKNTPNEFDLLLKSYVVLTPFENSRKINLDR